MYFDFTFVDMDECTLKTDGCNQRCINKEGSYLCSCEDGFVLNGTTTCQSMYFYVIKQCCLTFLKLSSTSFILIQPIRRLYLLIWGPDWMISEYEYKTCARKFYKCEAWFVLRTSSQPTAKWLSHTQVSFDSCKIYQFGKKKNVLNSFTFFLFSQSMPSSLCVWGIKVYLWSLK